MPRTAIVLAGGNPVESHLRIFIPEPDDVVAADSGLHQAGALCLHVDCIVGDFDSADASEVDAAVRAGASVERHPPDKDATDLELALIAAQTRGASRIVVVGGAGGRLDHYLANIKVLSSARFASAQVEALLGDARIAVVHGGGGRREITGRPGSLLTLLPCGGDALGITTEGLEYPLHNEDLPAGTTRGVSNVLTGESGAVTVTRGTLVVVQPMGDAR